MTAQYPEPNPSNFSYYYPPHPNIKEKALGLAIELAKEKNWTIEWTIRVARDFEQYLGEK